MDSVFVSLVFALRSAARSRAALHLEILALRHQVAVLNRSRPSRLRLTAADWALWAWLSRAWSGWRPALVLVKPATVLAWHRRGFRLFWTWKSRCPTGRPAAAPEVRALIRRMATANSLWGAPRIHGELQKLGISVSQATVAKYIPRRDTPPSQPGARSWPTRSTRSWRPISSSCPPSPTGCCSCSSSSRTTGDGLSTSPSPTTPPPPGRPNNSATPFPRTTRRGTCCTTATPHSPTSRPPSARCRSARSSRRRDHRGECLRRARHWLDPT